jgi:quercetin dioxygenase-like cupin family protein
LPVAAQQQPAPVKRTIVQKADVPGTDRELIYAVVDIAPNFKAGRHSHPGVVMAQIVEGEFWYAQDGQPEKIFKAGDTMTVPDHAIHNEGATDKGLKMNVVYVVEKGQPLTSPAK